MRVFMELIQRIEELRLWIIEHPHVDSTAQREIIYRLRELNEELNKQLKDRCNGKNGKHQ